MVDPGTRLAHIKRYGWVTRAVTERHQPVRAPNPEDEPERHGEMLNELFSAEPDDPLPLLDEYQHHPAIELENGLEFNEDTYLDGHHPPPVATGPDDTAPLPDPDDDSEAQRAGHVVGTIAQEMNRPFVQDDACSDEDGDDIRPGASGLGLTREQIAEHDIAIRMKILQARHNLSNSFLVDLRNLVQDCCGDRLDVSAGMKSLESIQLSYVCTPICWYGCTVFAGEASRETRCPKCSAPRYNEDGNECYARTFPLRKYIQRFCSSLPMDEVLSYQAKAGPQPGVERTRETISDWFDGEKAKEIRRNGFDWEKDLAFGVCFDAFTDSKTETTSYDAVVLRNMSLPPGLRSKKEMCIVYSILPRGLKNYDAVFQLLAAEMQELWEFPVSTPDINGIQKDRRALVVMVVADLKAIPHASGCSTYPAERGMCHRCHVMGVHFKGSHRTIYPPPLCGLTLEREADNEAKRAFLAGLSAIRGKRHRAKFARYAQQPHEPRTSWELEKFSRLRVRSLAAGAKKDRICSSRKCPLAPECRHTDPWKLTGVQSRSCLARFPLFDPVNDLCACSMHGFGNVVKEFERHLRGVVTSDAINASDETSDSDEASDGDGSSDHEDHQRHRPDPVEHARRDACALTTPMMNEINRQIKALKFPSGIQTPAPVFKIKVPDTRVCPPGKKPKLRYKGRFRARDALSMIAGKLLPILTGGKLAQGHQDAMMYLFKALDIAASHELTPYAVSKLEHRITLALVRVQAVFPLTISTSAMHQMVHLGQMWRRFGSLYNSSMWDFESIFGTLKLIVHGGRNRDVEMTKKLSARDLVNLARMRSDMDFVSNLRIPEDGRPPKRMKSLHPIARENALDPTFLMDIGRQTIECCGVTIDVDLTKYRRCLHNISCQYSYTYRTIHSVVSEREAASRFTSRVRRRQDGIQKAQAKFGVERVNAALSHVGNFVAGVGGMVECHLELRVLYASS